MGEEYMLHTSDYSVLTTVEGLVFVVSELFRIEEQGLSG